MLASYGQLYDNHCIRVLEGLRVSCIRSLADYVSAVLPLQ